MGNQIRPTLKKSCACCRSAAPTLEKKYEVQEANLLGQGTFAKVFKGTNKRTKLEVAVKVIDKANSRRDLLNTEIWILQNFGNHPNIVNFYDMYETEAEVQLVIELMPGGELFDLLDENGPYGEADAAKYLRAIASGLAYLHAGNVVHRDLKPENLLLTSKGPQGVLKISDFGLAKILIDEELMKVACGTWIYCAPEVLNLKQRRWGQYDIKCDVFSVGCILFIIMGGYHPFDFDGNDDEELMQECILSDTWDFDDPAWDEVSYQAKDLIEQMLRYNPQERITAAELAAHPWTTGRVSYGRLSRNIDKDLRRTRASLRNNKLEGVENVRRSLNTGAAGAIKIIEQAVGKDADPMEQLGAAAEPAALRKLSPTALVPGRQRGKADGTGGSPDMEVDAGTGGGALLVPRRRVSLQSNNSNRSCPQRRKAAPAAPEDAIPESKEDRYPQKRAGQPSANDAGTGDTKKPAVPSQNPRASNGARWGKYNLRKTAVVNDAAQAHSPSPAGPSAMTGGASSAVIAVDGAEQPQNMTVEALPSGGGGTGSAPPAEQEGGPVEETKSAKGGWGNKRKTQKKSIRTTQQQPQANPSLAKTKSAEWSKSRATKSLTTVDEWKAKRGPRFTVNNANTANTQAKAPAGKTELAEVQDASRNQAVNVDRKSMRSSRSFSQKKKPKAPGDDQDAPPRDGA